MPRSTYYAARNANYDKYESVKIRIMQIYEKSNKRKGYRWITHDLKEEGIRINHKTVFRLMKKLKIKSIVRAKKYSSYRGCINKECNIKNILQRDFSTTGLNQKWSTDVTEFKVLGRKIYLSGIMDLYNKEIIAYTIRFSPNLLMVTDMMKKAFEKREKPISVIIHSDQGWHYRHTEYINILRENKAIQSMSRKGNCLDNAVIENFWGTLKSEWFYLTKFDSVETFINELERYIYFYNNERCSPVLKYCTPVDFKAKNKIA